LRKKLETQAVQAVEFEQAEQFKGHTIVVVFCETIGEIKQQ